jgi:hypothetical protein
LHRFKVERRRHLSRDSFLLVSAGYAILTGAIWVFEAKRIRTTGADVITIFITLFVLECCLPGIVMYGCLPFVDEHEPTGNPVLDRIFFATDVPTAFLVLGLVAWTALCFYAFTALNGVLLRRVFPSLPVRSYFVVAGFPLRLVVVLTMGFLLTMMSFYTLGDTLVERYANLILLRARSEDVKATLLNTYGFVLTQTWGLLSVPALFVIFERRGRGLLWLLCLLFAVIFALLTGDRRAIFIPILLVYLTFVLFDGRWRVRFVAAAAFPILVWVAFGKELLGAIAYNQDPSEVLGRYSTLGSAVLRTASEVGLTLVESVGSISLLDLDARFGVDHLLSVLHRVPASWFGWDFELPKPIVRVATEEFSSSADSDIPPGLFGQMWLDFRVFGPIVWGFVLSLQMSIVQRVFSLTIPTRQAMAVFVLITFIIALPLDTGSYDFTFSADILLLMMCVWLTFKLLRVQVTGRNLGDVRTHSVGETPPSSLVQQPVQRQV